MDNNMREKIIEVANFIIENKATMEETAVYAKRSISSIKKYINDDDKLKSISPELYENVKKVQNIIINEGNIRGGKKGSTRGNRKNSDNQIIGIMHEMIEKRLTIEEASSIYDIPTSTLYERINECKDRQLLSKIEKLYNENKKRATKGLNK